MNPLLVATGWAMAKQGIADVVHRTILGAVAYAVFIVCGLTAAGFLTVAAFFYLAQTLSAIETSLIMAGTYALITVLGFISTLLIHARRRQAANRASIIPTATIAATTAGQGLPGGIASLGLAAAVGYLLARSMTRKK